MALPKIDQPLFSATVPSTGKKVKFRPFTVKEEKILLIAMESKDQDQIANAISQVVGNCVQGVDIETFATFDIEYFLMQLRAKSADNIFRTVATTKNGEEVELAIDVEKIEIKRDESHSKNIKISNEMHLIMRYPTFENALKIKEANAEAAFDLMLGCIESIVVGDEIFSVDDADESEKQEFIDSLSAKTIEQIKKFFETSPKMYHKGVYKDKEGEEHTFVLEGMETFFT